MSISTGAWTVGVLAETQNVARKVVKGRQGAAGVGKGRVHQRLVRSNTDAGVVDHLPVGIGVVNAKDGFGLDPDGYVFTIF
jgi:hypothetical protein